MKTKRVISIVCALVTVFMTSCGDGPMAKFYGKDSFVGRLFDTVKGWFMGEEPIKSYIENVAGIDMRMVCVDGGTFQMGATPEQVRDSEADESPVHTITLSTFYIGATEVTQAQWEAIMGTTIYEQRDKSGKKAINFQNIFNRLYLFIVWRSSVFLTETFLLQRF
jgi:formylglycine-generating enzyme required for sulfatase activity